MLITATVIAVRIVYTFIAASLIRWSRRADPREAGTPGWRQVAFLGWAGMRGGDSLVIALALPITTAAASRFPHGD